MAGWRSIRIVTLGVFLLALSGFLLFDPSAALAAAEGFALPGKDLSLPWVIPFACLLLSIAILPLTVPHIWHHHFGKIALGWGLAFLIPCFIAFGGSVTLYQFLHAIIEEYLPFIILLFALFTVAGGICLKGRLVGTPKVNLVILLIGTAIASWMGTTGAAMLLIRPILRANAHRKYRVHTVVFFIFLVANVGGSLTPLGDPPLFLGFLKGVDFFWTLTHLFLPMFFVSVILLGIYFFLDSYLYAKEGRPVPPGSAASNEKLRLEGTINFLFLAGIVAAVLISGMWQSEVGFAVYHVHVGLPKLFRDVLLLVIAYLSLRFTPKEAREANDFNWEPILEVAKLFFGIFISMLPAIAILRAGKDGALAGVISTVTGADGQPIDAAYFWITGLLSSFLDNAPTYLVFFNTAGGDAATLTTTFASTLTAISAGAVFMGANTYIGNAPNFMVRSIAENQGVAMPSFFGYMLWSVGILVPTLLLTTFVFFM